MRTQKTAKTLVVLLAGITIVPLLFPQASAHPRARRHTHRVTHRVVQPRAVIVVSEPRPVKKVVVINGRAYGSLDLNVKPKATEVWVDGRLRGTCDDFDGHPGKLNLLPGMHTVKLVTPDGVSVDREVRVRANTEFNVGLDLR